MQRAALPPYAPQLLNAGGRITSIQKFLGHKRLHTTLTYARAHDQTVADDYYQAMSSVEQRLELAGQAERPSQPVAGRERQALLALADQLALPDLDTAARLRLAERLRQVLTGQGEVFPSTALGECVAAQWDLSPPRLPVGVFAGP